MNQIIAYNIQENSNLLSKIYGRNPICGLKFPISRVNINTMNNNISLLLVIFVNRNPKYTKSVFFTTNHFYNIYIVYIYIVILFSFREKMQAPPLHFVVRLRIPREQVHNANADS